MSDPHGFVAEHFPNFYLWVQSLKTEAHFLALGMVASRDTVNPGDWLKIIGGIVLSSFATGYVTAERTAVEVKQYAAAQTEFRQEMRQFMREQASDTAALRDRMMRVETIMHPNGHQANGNGPGMSGRGSK